MNPAPGADDDRVVSYRLLEPITAIVLLLVIAALGWMTLAAYEPAWGQGAGAEMQVVIVLALLGAALVLVSVVALLHTR
jgi:hypothetical protein